jgi:hypothetical protein
MGFKDMVESDIHDVFLNLDEFASARTVIYDGTSYDSIPIVLTGLKEKDRSASNGDHTVGLYRVTSVMHCDIKDIGDVQPEQGKVIEISDEDDESFFHRFFIATSTVEMGMVRLELEAIDE